MNDPSRPEARQGGRPFAPRPVMTPAAPQRRTVARRRTPRPGAAGTAFSSATPRSAGTAAGGTRALAAPRPAGALRRAARAAGAAAGLSVCGFLVDTPWQMDRRARARGGERFDLVLPARKEPAP